MASSSSISHDSEEESIISYYFSRGYTYEVISEFLATFQFIALQLVGGRVASLLLRSHRAEWRDICKYK